MEIKIKQLLFFTILVSFVASYFFPGVANDSRIQNLITFIGILFGIIVGFFIADLYSRYQAIRNNAGTDSSCLSTFYLFAKILAKENKNKKWLSDVEKRIHKYNGREGNCNQGACYVLFGFIYQPIIGTKKKKTLNRHILMILQREF